MSQDITTGQRLIKLLEDYSVDTVFSIPGVHTLELYRGLANSSIRHVTPRHEQGAGFMADGYARVTGKPGVCFVITGPGLSNIATAMGQALADHIPMLVISTVNPQGSENSGCLHAMPDQQAMIRPLTVATYELTKDDCLATTMGQIFATLKGINDGKLGPVHLQIPLHVMQQTAPEAKAFDLAPLPIDTAKLKAVAQLINNHTRVAILAGGGAIRAQAMVQALASKLDAPVVTTINGRGLMAQLPLSVPASPSLGCVRSLLAQADCVIALGTEMGQTDYDMYVNGEFPTLSNLIRIDIDPQALQASNQMGVDADVAQALDALLPMLKQKQAAVSQGALRAKATREQALAELPNDYQKQHRFLQHISYALPNAIIVGDSTQPIYAGNSYFEPATAGGWFNSATGFGTLGYAVPAAIGAAIGHNANTDQRPIIAITGDGGLQFCLSELATAKDCGLPIIYLVWNNQGYGEIESSMLAVGITPVGVSPKPPQLDALAQAYGLQYQRLHHLDDLAILLQHRAQNSSPVIVEIDQQEIMAQL